MPRLSDTAIKAAIRTATKTGKGRKLFDVDGLFLHLKPTADRCSTWWRQRYRYEGKERLLSVGTYPEISLADARTRSAQLRKVVALGGDPSADRKAKRAAQMDARAHTFGSVADAWHEKFRPQWAPNTAKTIRNRLDDHVIPWLGERPVKEITAADVLQCVERVSKTGKAETARRILQIIKKVFRSAISRGLLATSPAAHIDPREELPAVAVTHRAAVKDPAEFGALLRTVDTYQGSYVVRCALRFLALTFVRPGELRGAAWPEITLEGKEPTWRIPGSRMKMGDADHLVPLSRQAVQILKELQPLTGSDGLGLVFPGERNASRPLSENTLNCALRSMGFAQHQHSAHGFRGTASTLLNERQWNKDAIERQLAHYPRDQVRAAYNSAQHLPERREMMQAWADYLDELKLRKVSQ